MSSPVTVPSAQGTRISLAAEETRAFGRALGARAQPGTLLALIGPLGAGKTQLAKGVADGLGVRGVVNSPTYVLMNEHPGRLVLFHVDAYRLADPEEALAAGLLDDRLVEGLAVIEWADRLAGWLPDERLEIMLVPDATDAEQRTIEWRAYGAAHADLVSRVEAAGS
jgi:tRNA threonylcarbamoyl adenosine modification protein YjeE